LSVAGIGLFDLLFALSVVVLVVLVFSTFKEYAVSNDEGLQQHYGDLIVAYYRSGFTDRSVFDFRDLYLYGGLFDMIAALLAQILPFDLYDIRHVMSAFAGVGGVVATWATARMIAGPRAGFMAGLALATCGVWYGGMFNHTKDVPFAAAMMGALYFLMRAARDLPDPRRADILWFGVLLGAALGLRATGLLMVGYVGVVTVLQSWPTRQRGWTIAAGHAVSSSAMFIPAFAIAYIIMVASWPWASLDFLNPVRGIFAFAHFHYPIRTILAGHVYYMGEVPRWYEPDYLAIKLPLLVLIGVAAALLSTAWSAVKRTDGRPDGARFREIGILAFVIVFPLACQVVCQGPSFTGMRHFLFVVPPIAALAGIGGHILISALEAKKRAVGFAAIAAVATVWVWNVVTLVRLHPYEYLFYNSVVGGLEGASRRYETDYWVNIMPTAVKDLEAYLDKTDSQATTTRPARLGYTVAVCGEQVSFENEADQRLHFTRDWSHADFFIAPTHMNCDRALRGKIVAVIQRVGVTIGVVKDLRGISPQARWAPSELAHQSDTDPDREPHG
jgi:Dolichyl-phosphate-mannose-protein mannosyltransferase